MTLTYGIVARALVALDPFRRVWGTPGSDAQAVPFTLRRKLTHLQRAAAEHASLGLSEVAQMARLVDPGRSFDVFPDVPPLEERQPVVLAHGPSVQNLLPSLRTHRSRLYVVAPLRTALRLADADILADVVVLADGADGTSALSISAWQTAPATQRRSLEKHATLVMGPLAPAAIHSGFADAAVFDDGLGWLDAEAALPFWGSALLPSICLPLALGASTVAIGGMDMGATRGRACRTWSGRPMRLDARLSVAHGLLEALGTSLPGRLIDLSGESVAKRGFEHLAIERLLERMADVPAHPARRDARACASDALARVLDAANGLAPTVAAMAATGSRAASLVASDDDSGELAEVIEQMESGWAREPGCRAAIVLLQPPYLRALWRLRAAGIAPRNPHVSTTMKARLIGPEIASLETTYHEWLGTIREAVGSRAAGRPTAPDATLT